jgi:hypothetical protein
MVLISLWLGKTPCPSCAHATFARMKDLHVRELISRQIGSLCPRSAGI